MVDFGRGKGRGVVAMQRIAKGEYVCEYRTYRVYPVGSVEEAQHSREYEVNGEGSYVLQTAYPVPEFGARLCFDATRRYSDVGRLINHSSALYNLKPGTPLFLRGKWWVGMVAVRDIFPGQELTYDYGVRSENWMRKTPHREENDGGGQGVERAGGNTQSKTPSTPSHESSESDVGGGGMIVRKAGGRSGKVGTETGNTPSTSHKSTESDVGGRGMIVRARASGKVGTKTGNTPSTSHKSTESDVGGRGMIVRGRSGEVGTETGNTPSTSHKSIESDVGGRGMIVRGRSGKVVTETGNTPSTSHKSSESDVGGRGMIVRPGRSGKEGTATRKTTLRGSDVGGLVTSEEMSGGAMEISEEEELEADDIHILEDSSTAPARHNKRNYFWCPEVDCTSGPVQKMTQHLQKKHKMPTALASQVAKKKRRAPAEAIQMKVPNPHTRSSGLQHLGFFVKKSPQSSTTTPSTTTPPGPAPTDSRGTSSRSNPPPTRPSTPSMSGNFHQGGPFLDGFRSHLRTRAGGQRGENSAAQITRYVGKYLHYLNAHRVVEGELLEPAHVEPYLEEVQKAGIRSSGILHRILAHKAAVQYMRLGVS